jgi:hypothetical protein
MSTLRSKLIKLAKENPELRDDLLPILAEEAKVAKSYPSPMRGKALSEFSSKLQYAVEDATGTGVSFKGDTADKFGKRMKEIKERLNKADSAIMDVAGSIEALARDLKKVK